MKKKDKKSKTKIKEIFGALKNWKLDSQKFKDEIREEEIEQDEGFSRALLSENVFARDWLSKEDEEAWKDL